MAQQSQMKTKSNVVYASEAIDRLKAYNRQKSDLEEIEEGKEDNWPSIKDAKKQPKKVAIKYDKHMGTHAPQVREEKEVDPEHPYVDVMPMTNGNEKRAKEQMKLAKKVGLTNA